MKWILPVLILLVGCKAPTTTPTPPAPTKLTGPPIPKLVNDSRASIRPMVVAAPVETSKPRDYYIPLQYPADAANYLWQLQQSTNHTNWVTIGPTNGYQVGTNFYWYGGPVSNWDYTVTVPKAKTYFWRLIGTSKY